jgi:hypothetical protein
MKTGLFIICCSLVLSGCKNHDRIPAGIIPQKKMQAILWDMMRADQFLADFVLRKDSSLDKKTESTKLYGQVFSIHHISQEQFGKSFSFYKTHPALFKMIMDSLSMPTASAPTEMIKQPNLPDSNQRSVPGRARTDSVISLRRKKVIAVE